MTLTSTRHPSLVPLSCIVLSFLTESFYLATCVDVAGHYDWTELKEDEVDLVQSHQGMPKETCNLSSGEWVFDTSYPLYEPNCPYLSTQVSCQKNGRPDSDYERWKWKPQQCSLPRFNALDFLERIRKKRVMLVGDSIMRNQWESLVCLVEAVIPSDMKMVSAYGPDSIAFHAMNFQASIEFNWAPLLVELKEDSRKKRVLHLDSIDKNSEYWRGVDILVFDSAHWWTHSGKWHSWDYYKEGERIFTELNPMVAYEKGLTTWARWIDMNLDPHQTQVIFRSASPRHNKSERDRNNGWQCYKHREPAVYLGYTPHTPAQLMVLREVLKKMNFPVYLLDITNMSALRTDGHPSIYTTTSSKEGGSDCSHWCLPGVPDTWNEMLYALL